MTMFNEFQHVWRHVTPHFSLSLSVLGYQLSQHRWLLSLIVPVDQREEPPPGCHQLAGGVGQPSPSPPPAQGPPSRSSAAGGGGSTPAGSDGPAGSTGSTLGPGPVPVFVLVSVLVSVLVFVTDLPSDTLSWNLSHRATPHHSSLSSERRLSRVVPPRGVCGVAWPGRKRAAAGLNWRPARSSHLRRSFRPAPFEWGRFRCVTGPGAGRGRHGTGCQAGTVTGEREREDEVTSGPPGLDPR